RADGRPLFVRRRSRSLRRDVQGDGAGGGWPFAVLSARRQLLLRLRPELEVSPYADDHAGRQPLRLSLRLRGRSMPWVTPAYADACFAPSYASARGKFLLAADRAGARLDVLVNAEARAPNGGTLTTDVAVLGPPEAEGALL